MWNRVSERSSFVCEQNLFSFYLSCTQTHVFALCSYLLGQTAHQEEAIIASMCWLPSPPHVYVLLSSVQRSIKPGERGPGVDVN